MVVLVLVLVVVAVVLVVVVDVAVGVGYDVVSVATYFYTWYDFLSRIDALSRPVCALRCLLPLEADRPLTRLSLLFT